MTILKKMTAPEKFLAETLKKRGYSSEAIEEELLLHRKFLQKDKERTSRLIAEKMIIKSE